MTLPSLQSRIRVLNTYPDRVRPHFEYRLPEGTTFNQVRDYFHGLGFMQISRRAVLRDTIEGSRSGCLFDVMLSYARAVSILHVYTEFNVLRHLHRQCRAVTDECSLDRTTNWLPARLIGRNNRRIWNLAEDLLWEAEADINDLVSTMVSELGGTTHGIYRAARVELVEASIDIAADNPFAIVRGLQRRFQQIVRPSRLLQYLNRSLSRESLDENALVLAGDLYRHETYKLYTKTNRRVRLECVMGQEAFSRLGLSPSLENHDDSFTVFFERIAEHCVAIFNEVIAEGQLSSGQADTTLRFLIEIASACKDQDRAETLVRILAETGRVTSQFGYAHLKPFVRRGLIEPSRRGIYVVTPSWQSAIREVAEMLGTRVGNLLWGMAR